MNGVPAPSRRVSVTRLVAAADELALVPLVATQPVTRENYAAFKHGDTTMLDAFAMALLEAAVPALPGPGLLLPGPVPVPRERTRLYLTSSGYGSAPPAAAALVPPVAAALRRDGWDVREFRMHRTSITAGDYATLPPELRARALSAEQLIPDLAAGELRGATVLALDDIIVTGVHERAQEIALRRAGVAETVHAYLVDASASAACPAVEATMNGFWIDRLDELIALAHSPGFTPNSRFLKTILRLDARARSRCLAGLPAELITWMARAVAEDRMHELPDLAEGAAQVVAQAAARDRKTFP